MNTLIAKLVGQPIQEYLAEVPPTQSGRATGDDRELAGMKAKFMRRMQGAGRDPEAEWKKAEPTYRRMLAEPEIQSQIRSQPGPEVGRATGTGTEIYRRGRLSEPTAPTGLASQIYSAAERLHANVPADLQGEVQEIMRMAMELAQQARRV